MEKLHISKPFEISCQFWLPRNKCLLNESVYRCNSAVENLDVTGFGMQNACMVWKWVNLPEIFITLISEMSSLSNNCDFFSLSTQTIRTHTFHGVSKRKSVELVKTTHSVHCECWQHTFMGWGSENVVCSDFMFTNAAYTGLIHWYMRR